MHSQINCTFQRLNLEKGLWDVLLMLDGLQCNITFSAPIYHKHTHTRSSLPSLEDLTVCTVLFPANNTSENTSLVMTLSTVHVGDVPVCTCVIWIQAQLILYSLSKCNCMGYKGRYKDDIKNFIELLWCCLVHAPMFPCFFVRAHTQSSKCMLYQQWHEWGKQNWLGKRGTALLDLFP